MPTMTPRQREVLTLLQAGEQPTQIANQLGISRNAVYQQIHTLRKRGHLPAGWTATGRPPRSDDSGAAPGAAVLQSLLAANPDGTNEDPAAVAASMAYAELRRLRDELSEQVRRLNEYLPH